MAGPLRTLAGAQYHLLSIIGRWFLVFLAGRVGLLLHEFCRFWPLRMGAAEQADFRWVVNSRRPLIANVRREE